MTDPNEKTAERAAIPFPDREPASFIHDEDEGDGFVLDFDVLAGDDEEVGK